ncbi:hypothetical protein ACFQY9_24955 [Microvirga aerilata]|uniref:hypothetical protein n=1 Tax=Microvirga aerilata TaxID=670292 RepID=UPI0036388409
MRGLLDPALGHLRLELNLGVELAIAAADGGRKHMGRLDLLEAAHLEHGVHIRRLHPVEAEGRTHIGLHEAGDHVVDQLVVQGGIRHERRRRIGALRVAVGQAQDPAVIGLIIERGPGVHEAALEPDDEAVVVHEAVRSCRVAVHQNLFFHSRKAPKTSMGFAPSL